MEPTPRPWVANDMAVETAIVALEPTYVHIGIASDSANAELIVKCVNLHDELVEQLKQAWACIEHLSDKAPTEMWGDVKSTLKDISDIIAKTEGMNE